MDVREKLVELFYDNNVRCDQKIEGLADDVMDIIANGVTVQDGNDNNVPTKWISVNDRLPQEDGSYLVTINSFNGCKYIDVRWFAKDGEIVDKYELAGQENVWYYYDSEWGYISIDSVTHWMPLPQPPKGE